MRGKQAVAIIDAAELERLMPPSPAVFRSSNSWKASISKAWI